MAPETEELIKLIASADDPDRAALTAFAVLLEYFKQRDTEKRPPSSKREVGRAVPPS